MDKPRGWYVYEHGDAGEVSPRCIAGPYPKKRTASLVRQVYEDRHALEPAQRYRYELRKH